MPLNREKIEEEQRRIDLELEGYRKLLRKLREKQQKELSEEPEKTVPLSVLSKLSIKEVEPSKEDKIDSQLKHCVDCIILAYS